MNILYRYRSNINVLPFGARAIRDCNGGFVLLVCGNDPRWARPIFSWSGGVVRWAGICSIGGFILIDSSGRWVVGGHGGYFSYWQTQVGQRTSNGSGQIKIQQQTWVSISQHLYKYGFIHILIKNNKHFCPRTAGGHLVDNSGKLVGQFWRFFFISETVNLLKTISRWWSSQLPFRAGLGGQNINIWNSQLFNFYVLPKSFLINQNHRKIYLVRLCATFLIHTARWNKRTSST